MTDVPLSMIRNHRPNKTRAEINRQKSSVHSWQFDNPIVYREINGNGGYCRIGEVWDMEGVEVIG